jgi:hypothetical protein
VIRRLRSLLSGVVLATLVSACGNKTARAPNPTAYDWPDSLTYRVQLTWELSHGAEVVGRYGRSKLLRFAVNNDRYLVWNDSLNRVGSARDTARLTRRLWPEDTLHYYVRLSRLGEILESEPGCDPAIPECKAALPSALPLEIRRIIPRLPVWWPPKGHEWVDTLPFDDLPRARGSRGSVITHYRDARDTVLSGRGFWIVTWSSVRRSSHQTPLGTTIADAPVEERGTVYVDKVRLLPACAGWSGASAAAPTAQAPGVTGEHLRGRAYLSGSPCEPLVAGP